MTIPLYPKPSAVVAGIGFGLKGPVHSTSFFHSPSIIAGETIPDESPPDLTDDMLNPHKGLELDLKTVCDRKINNNKSPLTVNSNSVLLGDARIYKTNQKQDSMPWLWSIRLPRLILHSVRWTNTIQLCMAQSEQEGLWSGIQRRDNKTGTAQSCMRMNKMTRMTSDNEDCKYKCTKDGTKITR